MKHSNFNIDCFKRQNRTELKYLCMYFVLCHLVYDWSLEMLQPLHQQQGQEAEVGLRLQPVPGAGLVVEVHLVLLQHGQLGLQPLGRLHPRLLDRVLLDEAGVDLVSGVQRQPLLVGHRLEVIVGGQLVGDLGNRRELDLKLLILLFSRFTWFSVRF